MLTEGPSELKMNMTILEAAKELADESASKVTAQDDDDDSSAVIAAIFKVHRTNAKSINRDFIRMVPTHFLKHPDRAPLFHLIIFSIIYYHS
jgi:hypothetical protein